MLQMDNSVDVVERQTDVVLIDEVDSVLIDTCLNSSRVVTPLQGAEQLFCYYLQLSLLLSKRPIIQYQLLTLQSQHIFLTLNNRMNLVHLSMLA
jgi:hypothetical protein